MASSGTYFLNDDEGEHRHADFIPIIPNLFNSRSDNTLKVAAVFGDLSYGLTDKLRLNAGARFNHEESGTHYVGAGVYDAPDSDVGGTQNATTGRLGLDYTFHPGLMVYGTLSKGFQSGVFRSEHECEWHLVDPGHQAGESLRGGAGRESRPPESRRRVQPVDLLL